jgi:hypothetical protein
MPTLLVFQLHFQAFLVAWAFCSAWRAVSGSAI